MAAAAAAAALVALAGCGGGGKKDAAPASTTTAPPVTLATWTTFPTDDARFRTVWPRQPIRAEESIPIEGGSNSKVVVYKVDVALGEYSVVWADLTGGLINPPEILAQVQTDVLAEVKGTLSNSIDTSHKGHPAKELMAKLEDGGYIKSRIIVTKRDLFIVQATSPVPEPSRYAEFVNAFEVL